MNYPFQWYALDLTLQVQGRYVRTIKWYILLREQSATEFLSSPNTKKNCLHCFVFLHYCSHYIERKGENTWQIGGEGQHSQTALIESVDDDDGIRCGVYFMHCLPINQRQSVFMPCLLGLLHSGCTDKCTYIRMHICMYINWSGSQVTAAVGHEQ